MTVDMYICMYICIVYMKPSNRIAMFTTTNIFNGYFNNCFNKHYRNQLAYYWVTLILGAQKVLEVVETVSVLRKHKNIKFYLKICEKNSTFGNQYDIPVIKKQSKLLFFGRECTKTTNDKSAFGTIFMFLHVNYFLGRHSCSIMLHSCSTMSHILQTKNFA